MPTVMLIEYPGSGHHDKWHGARLLIYAKSTRLEQGASARETIWHMGPAELMKELEAVANSVHSSWEFCSNYIFEIRGVTRAFTHQLVRTRYGVSFAQQAQRVADMSAFDCRVPDSVVSAGLQAEWDLCMYQIHKTYAALRAGGIAAQDARGVLPTNVLTNILARFDLRALADMLGKRDNLRAQDEYAEVARMMKREVYAVHPWAKMFCEPERTNTPVLDRLLNNQLNGRSPVDVPELNSALKELDKVKATWG